MDAPVQDIEVTPKNTQDHPFLPKSDMVIVGSTVCLLVIYFCLSFLLYFFLEFVLSFFLPFCLSLNKNQCVTELLVTTFYVTELCGKFNINEHFQE